MKSSDFVHLHSHTMFSLLDGASKLGDIAQVAAEWEMPAVAMTDHGNMFGTIASGCYNVYTYGVLWARNT